MPISPSPARRGRLRKRQLRHISPGHLDLTSTGTGAFAGNITLDGTGGDGTSDNYGVYIKQAGTEITTVDGDITITGTGGAGTANQNYGVFLETATIASTGVAAGAGNIA